VTVLYFTVLYIHLLHRFVSYWCIFSDMTKICHSIWGHLQPVQCTSVFWRTVSRCGSLWSITVRQWTSCSSWLVRVFIIWNTVVDGTIGLRWTLIFISSGQCRFCRSSVPFVLIIQWPQSYLLNAANLWVAVMNWHVKWDECERDSWENVGMCGNWFGFGF